MSGYLYLIPTYLSGANDRSFLAPSVVDIIQHTTHFLVENERTARRFISSLKANIDIPSLHFEVLDKATPPEEIRRFFKPVYEGKNIGLMSEAGLPCLADPGNLAVRFAHQHDIRVIPLPGSSSIQLALIASGFNGQQFSFHGYLPIEKNARIRRIRELEKGARTGYTQLFMETPYRNHQLVEDIFRTCAPDTWLSIASDVSGQQEMIRTLPIKKWQNTSFDIHKIPSIFSFGRFL